MIKFIIPALLVFFVVLFWGKITDLVDKKFNIKLNYIVVILIVIVIVAIFLLLNY